MAIGYIHIAKKDGYCACVVSEDIDNHYEIFRDVVRSDVGKSRGGHKCTGMNPLELCLKDILKWQNDLMQKGITQLIILSHYKTVWSHIKRCEKKRKYMYDFEKDYVGKFKIEIYCATPSHYCKAMKYCKEEFLNEKLDIETNAQDKINAEIG